MHITLDPTTIAIFWKLSLAMVCGVVLGTERIIAHKTAGMRTYALVSMGAALFVIISEIILGRFSGGVGVGPFHIVGAIITGIGFMGAGVIILRGTSVVGLTTASGLWVAAGIGVACGFGLFPIALIATILTLFIFVILWYVEQGIKRISPQEGHDDHQS